MPHITPRPRKNDRPDRPTRWLVTWDLRPGPGGKRRRVTETVRGTKTVAIERRDERQAEITAAGKGYTQPSKQTVAEYMESWLRTYVDANLRPKSVSSYHSLARIHIVPQLGDVPLADLNTPLLQGWVTDLRQPNEKGKKLFPRSIALAHTVLHGALEEAVRVGLLPTNPADRVRLPKPNPKIVEALTLEQVHAIDQIGEGHRLGPLFSFLWQSGLRISEAIGLRWEDVNLERGSVSVKRQIMEVGGHLVEGPPKSRAGRREIALPEQATSLLREHLLRQRQEREAGRSDWNPTGLVFPSVAGTPLGYHNVRRVWVKVLIQAEIRPCGLHALRHPCGALMLWAGVDLRTLSQYLGHEDVAFTVRVYAHVLEQTKTLAAEKFTTLLAKGLEL
ncbi:MAG: tyrosine-type recombinase/integrase [Sulfobacillus sp.]